MGRTGDSPPPSMPPFETNNEEKQNDNHQPRSTLNKPQSFPSSHDDEDDYASQIEAQSISTPPNEDDFGSPIKPQAFPISNEEAVPFPPPNEYESHQHAPPQPSAMPQGHGGGVPVHLEHLRMQGSPFINQAATLVAAATPTGWNSDFFDCLKDPLNALVTAFFPCVTFGQIAEIVDSGHTSCRSSGIMYSVIAFCIGIPCIMSCTYRAKLRSKFRIIESPAPDWVVHCLCECCALCQEYRELKERGYDPSIGWQGNVAKQQQMQQFAIAAPMRQRMM